MKILLCAFMFLGTVMCNKKPAQHKNLSLQLGKFVGYVIYRDTVYVYVQWDSIAASMQKSIDSLQKEQSKGVWQ